MEWLLIGLLILAVLVNFRSFVLLNRLKQQQSTFDREAEDLYRNLEQFTADVEEKNNRLYKDITDHLETQEIRFSEKIENMQTSMAAGGKAPVGEEFTAVRAGNQEDGDLPETPADSEENHKVETLYKQGFSPDQIAKVLGMERGKTEVIINMLNKKRSYQK